MSVGWLPPISASPLRMLPTLVTSTTDERAPGTVAGFWSQMTTPAPLCTSSSAIARPMPFAPPVTIANFRLRS
jgi:hypothetical protein